MSNAKKHRFVARSLAVLALGVVAASVQATNNPVIFNQYPADNTGNSVSSQRSNNQVPTDFAVTADDFTLCTNPVICTSFTITDVHWTGSFFNPPNEGQPTDFEIKFYADAGGLPGAIVPGGSFSGFGTAGKSATCPLNAAANPQCTYDVNLPGLGLTLAGGHYWMSIVADLTFPPQWGWITAGTGNAVQNFFGAGFAPTGFNQAFQLTGVLNQAPPGVPEPASIALLGLGLAGLGLARRRKQG